MGASPDFLRSMLERQVQDPRVSPGNRRFAQLQLENLDRQAQGRPQVPYPEDLRDPNNPDFSSALLLLANPEQLLELEDREGSLPEEPPEA